MDLNKTKLQTVESSNVDPNNKIDKPLIVVESLRQPPVFKAVHGVPHACSVECLKEESLLATISGVRIYDSWVGIDYVSPYCVPLFLGFVRTKGRSKVYYVGPCGKRFKKIQSLHQYLVETNSKLSIDQFTFEFDVTLLSYDRPIKVFSKVNDISAGREQVPISCVNEIDNQAIKFDFIYTTEYVPGPNVKLNFDKNFLISCECKNGCKNHYKCPCLHATREEAVMLIGEERAKDAGYKYLCVNNKSKSLIFECNQKCKCDKKCLNRLVQHGLKHQLQVFKTSDRGWGCRTLHDIPRGAFVCTYTGQVIDLETFISPTHENGYVVELDYIKSSNKAKRDFDYDSDSFLGTDSEVSTPTEGSTDESIKYDSDLDLEVNGSETDAANNQNGSSAELPIDEQLLNEILDEGENNLDKLVSMSVDQLPQVEDEVSREFSTLMKHLEVDENYSVDGKLMGNIGRFLNHSCEPNCVIMNVFIESQDYRLPALAFFALQNIKAYDELTWDYGYPTEERYIDRKKCLCGSLNCKQVIY